MKKLLLISIIAMLFAAPAINAQTIVKNGKALKPTWITSDPFKTKVFVENDGQFNNWVQTTDTIKYALINSNRIFLTRHGLVFRIDKVEAVNKTAREENEQEADSDENPPLIEKYYVKMNWMGCNPDAKMEVSEQAEGYYTFGEKGYENVKAKGYKKIVYKNLYHAIDVEYIIPQKGGIEYKLILHPGADISQVKMQYTGDIENCIIDFKGNLQVNTPAGAITDHAPQSYYEDNKTNILSFFVLKNNQVSFKLNEPTTPDPQHKTIIVDPWIITPDSLTTDNSAYDIAYDDYGNTYVSGGTVPFKLSKYSAAGGLLWTYTVPAGWAQQYYSKFCILPQSGTSFIGEGFDVSGPMVEKINSSGTLTYTAPSLAGNKEIWLMFYNRCVGKLIGFGGGTANPNNLQVFTDTNLTSSICRNFDGYSTSDNDIAATVEDYNGDFYSLISSQVAHDNRLLKSLISNYYAPPLAFDTNSNYNYYECSNSGIPGFNSDCTISSTVRANALAINQNYLFSYDGRTLEVWDKTNGALVGSIIVDTGYAGGQFRTHEGIAVDDCNDVYVGGTNQVHVFTFNGSTFTSGTSITANIPNEVYDMSLNRMTSTLYICGLGFVTVIAAPMACAPVEGPQCDTSSYINNISSDLFDFFIYPNPANDKIEISTSQNSLIEILNFEGQALKSFYINNNPATIDISAFAKGMYFVKATTGKGIEVKKFVKE
jgi:hypothetical protein